MKTIFKRFTLLLLLCSGIAEAQEVSNGILEFRIRDETTGEPIPGKLVFLQNGSPASLSIPSGELLFSRDNIVYSANGKGRIALPAGRYEIWAGHGLEYSVSKHRVTIEPNQELLLAMRLRREIDTRGYVGTDLRLQPASFSGQNRSVAEHIICCVAEGLELAAVTEPQYVQEYQMTLAQLGLEAHLQIRAGPELTISFGHFSAYPLPQDFNRTFENVEDAGKLFDVLRALPTHPVIQVNHPRNSANDYFTQIELDPDFAVSRLPQGSFEFDALEVLNQTGIDWYAEKKSIPPHQDWYNLLNSGSRVTAVGNSGGHDQPDMIPGLPRNYIASSVDTPGNILGTELIAGLRNHHVVVSRGIFIDMEVHGGFPVGRQVSAKKGLVTFDVSVQAPTWVACDTLKLIANGRVKHTLILKEDRIAERFHGTLTVRPTVDTWYVMTATGSRPLAPMYATPRRALMPLGFTNPIWVDADGDGKFTTVKERAVALIDSFRHDPKALAEKVKDDAALLKFVIGHVGTHDFENKSELLEKLLSPANLNLRLRIYDFLSQEKDAMAQAALWFRAKSSVQSEERMAIALARYRLGETEQWQVALEHAKRVSDKGDVRAAFENFPARPLRNWQIVGPFEITQADIFEQVFAPGQQVDLAATYEALQWHRHKTPESGLVNLDELFGANEHGVAYAYTEFNSSTTGEMLFKLSSDDGIVIWLNGEEVYRNYAEKTPYDLVVLPVTAGKNSLLLRDENRGGDWGFAVEVVDELGWIE